MTRQRARTMVAQASKDGRLTRGACSVTGCRRGPTDGHHEDYTKPLEVVWLCRLHHLMRHREYESVAPMLDHFKALRAGRVEVEA